MTDCSQIGLQNQLQIAYLRILQTSQFEHFCKVEVEELKCGDPAEFYLAQGLQFNCNKELQTRCEVSCDNGEASSEFVQCTIKKGRVNWKPSSLQCKAVEGETQKESFF